MPRPLIGISSNLFAAEPRASYNGKALLVTDRAMVRAIERAGGVPLLLPLSDRLADLMASVDGLLLTGGADIDPTTWGGEVGDWPGQPERDRYELEALALARERRLPVLGVCRGHQLLNVAFGGTLTRDLPTERASTVRHRDRETYDQNRHTIEVLADSWLSDVLGPEAALNPGCMVNSVHHQGIDRLGDGLTATAWAPDGLIEAVEARADRWTLGVQWHPEWDERPEHAAIFRRFVEVCE